ncbi:MAG: DUF234 domain-containing protein, partial [Candidatus Verstraetearchaeota archaeon]|nr:DUF234 domain-containing protein [Candidatus Verstraetearchaeota archaeon]
WFRFVWRNYPDRLGEGGREFSEGLDGFLARRFERLAGEIAVLPFEPTRKGRWWGARREGGERRVEEIDLVALDERASQIAFVEAKWSRLGEREARRELGRLGEKAKLVDWRPGSRKEHFGLVAREVGGKEGLRQEGFLVFDLEELRRNVHGRGLAA